MHQKTLVELSAGMLQGSFSSEELTRACLARISQYDGELNSFVTVVEAQALAAAKAADARIKAGNAGPLTGIPFAHKDIFCTRGVKTSCGSMMLDNFISPYDATVTEKLLEAGAVMVGKTNMDEFAMGSSNETSFYGAVKNPWDAARVPGGSSGGSAAAVAARLVPAGTGTDTGGSILQPADEHREQTGGIYYGRVSRYRVVAFASSLDQGGTFTRTAADAAVMLGAMAGFDRRDSTSVDRPVDDYRRDLDVPLQGLKIGLPKEYFGEGLDAGVAAVIEAALTEYRKLGATIIDITLPHTHLSVPAYYVVAPAECSSNLSRFDGVRFGYRARDPKDLEDLYTRSRGEGFGDEVKRRILIGTYALSAGYYDAYYLQAQKVRRLIRDDFLQAFEQVDVIMGPTTPSVAFKLGEKADDPVSMYLSDIYTIAVNLAGLPAMSIPAGFSADLPVGLHITGNHFAEAKLLNVAHRFQQATDWHARSPQGFA